MRFSIITLFPEVFYTILNSSILKKARGEKLVEFELINLRDFGEGIHKQVDDKPYGGGPGMLLKVNVLAKAWSATFNQKGVSLNYKPYTILTSASGKPFTQQKAKELSKLDQLIIVCGHYEGVDQRFIEKYVTEEISIGDYILTGGEIPAMVIVDSVTRLIKGVLKKEKATEEESFENDLLEYPQYTRPENFARRKVPLILLSGNHQQILKWRKSKSVEKTKKIRPDLLKKRI